MTADDPLERRSAEAWPAAKWRDETIVAAVSGGADSTALLAALTALRPAGAAGRIVAAHFNHRLRGAESDADETLVRATAARLGVECVVGAGDVVAAAAERGEGMEEAARDARYRFLIDTALRFGARYLATAHTLDDQAETVLHRLLRGTGLFGLSGIPRVRGLAGGTIGLVRPLLTVRRSEVVEYLARRGLPFRHDASNDDPTFTRNRIRRELLPLLARDYNPQIVDALARLSVQADDVGEITAALVEPLLRTSLVRADGDGWELDCTVLGAAPRHLVRETCIAAWKQCGLPLRAMGFDEWDALAEAASAPTSAFDLPGGIRVRKSGDRLCAVRVQSQFRDR